ncbi:MAG: cytochrome c oxidase assembly protein [Actinobacteria bacterium]|nr:cytochrome c oxidase assembly protein [Actinomycetota bacterium]
MKPVTFNFHTALTAWEWSPFAVCVAAGVLIAGYLYLRGDWRLAARGRRWRWWRTVSFFAGLLAVDVALQSPVSTFTNSYFQAHIVQHLLLMTVAPPLMALGAPSTLLLQAGPDRAKRAWRKVLHSRPFAWVSHPVPVWFGYFGAMFAFFLTPAVNYAMEHMALMDAINLFFLMGGCFYWWPIVEVDPIVHWRMSPGAKVLNLALAAPFESFLGIAIMMSKHPEGSMYTLSGSHWGGGLLWASTEFSTIIGLIPVMWAWVHADERSAKRADARLDAVASQRTPKPLPKQAPAVTSGAALLLAEGPAEAPPMLIGDRFKPLLQPGNSTWEQMWRAKAGFVPGRTPRRSRPDRP